MSFGKTNDDDYFNEMKKLTGKEDSRYFVRGKINWDKANQELKNTDSFTYKVEHPFEKDAECSQSAFMLRKRRPEMD